MAVMLRRGDDVGSGGSGLRGVPRVLGVGLGRGWVAGRGVAVGSGSGRWLLGWVAPRVARVARIASSTCRRIHDEIEVEETR